MSRKPRNAQPVQANTQPKASPVTAGQGEATSQKQEGASQDQASTQQETKQNDRRFEKKANAKTKGGIVDAVLKTRHCRGGLCKEAGETMRMTQGEYQRLKKYGRVE